MTQVLKTLRKKPLALVGFFFTLLLILTAIFAPYLAPYDPTKPDFTAVLAPPNGDYLLGTDEIGRDVLSRIIYGTRVSLQAGILASLLGMLVGVPIGIISGYYRGWLDELVIMRIVDAMLAFPIIVLALALTAVLGPSLHSAIIAIGIVFAPTFVRLARAQTLAVRELDYSEAARALGNRDARILAIHVLPNTISPIIVQASLSVAVAILVEAALSFLGLGVQPPTASWGSMLRLGMGYMREAPWISIWPGLMIYITVLSINFFGDGLKSALDPKSR